MSVNHMRETHNVKGKSPGRPKRGSREVNLKEIGERIRQLRGKESQIEFAGYLGITQGQLSRYEKGSGTPSLSVLLRLKKKCGRSTDWILTGKEGL